MISGPRADYDTGVLRFSVLGPLRASCGDVVLPLGGAKQQMVLALLLLEANTVVTADRLIDWVWGEDARGRTVNTLQVKSQTFGGFWWRLRAHRGANSSPLWPDSGLGL